MVLIFSKVQRCNIKDAPKGYYGYKEEFDAPAEMAKQLVEANVAGYVVKNQEPAPVPEPVQEPAQEAPADETVQTETPEVTQKKKARR
jgi:hypothetical protein